MATGDHLGPPSQQWDSGDFNDDLEREQSGRFESDRRRSQGREGDLTELAPPRPVTDRRRRTDSLEHEEEKASWRRKSHTSSATERDNELTEVAAPPPVERDAQSDEEAAPQPEQEKDEAEEKEPSYSQKATELYTVSWLIFFSFLGTLARLGVEAITIYPGAPWSSPVLWANLGGSFALGFLIEDRNLFRHEWAGQHSAKNSFHPSKISKDTDSIHAKAAAAHGKVKKTIPLYIGLATGFCGSFTSFSTFMRDVFLALTNDLPLASPSPYRESPIILRSFPY
jgi:fluoride exporter